MSVADGKVSPASAAAAWWWRPLTVAALVLALYVGWAAAVVAPGGDPMRLARVGQQYLDKGHGSSPAIDSLASTDEVGYDGQWAVYIGLDPRQAGEYMDRPAYRYSRPLYPLIARALALGDSGALGWALLLLNIAAAAVLTFAVASFLMRFGASPWYALIVGLSPGLAAGILLDLTEPLAYALAAVGMLLVTRRGSLIPAAVAFALAGLARETALLFPLAAAIGIAFGLSEEAPRRVGRPWQAAGLLAGSLAPAVVLRIVLSSVAPEGESGGLPFEAVPLSGLLGQSPFGVLAKAQLITVVVPACLALLLVPLFARRLTTSLIALALNVVALVVFLGSGGYLNLLGSLRTTLGVPLAFALSLAAVRSRRRRLELAIVPTALWSVAWVVVVVHMARA